MSEMSSFSYRQFQDKYAWREEHGDAWPVEKSWPQTAQRVVPTVLAALGYEPEHPKVLRLTQLVAERKFMPGGRYLYATGREFNQTQNCLLLKAEDSREGWASLSYKAFMALMTGAGIGVDYSDLREEGALIAKTGGEASGPVPLMRAINEIGRNVMQGGKRRSAIWAGLRWSHPDIFKFMAEKDWSDDLKAMKEKDYNFPMPLDSTNVSVLLDDEFFEAYHDEAHPKHFLAHRVYREGVRLMVTTAEPGFSVDIGPNAGETLRNACTEITSRDDSDICNLGSINLARVESLDEMRELVELGTLFLLAGTEYSMLPYDEVYETRQRNRRLGLGLMGVHEWLLKRGHKYGPCEELVPWLDAYAESGEVANRYADRHGLTRPIATRAIAPTGTIGIVAETTTGIEPVFCVAYKRLTRDARAGGGAKINYEFVIDPTAKRLIDNGVDPDAVEDAYSLSYDVERRIKFQAWMQQWVDHGISSTVNLPEPMLDLDEQKWFGDMLMKYLPQLRGITCYPDGSRGGQPLQAVPYAVAVGKEGVLFESEEDTCKGGICGI